MTDTTELRKALRKVQERCFAEDESWAHDILSIVVPVLDEASAMPQPASTVEAGDALPIDMVLFCPNCGLQHIDEPDERTPDWDNPPHRSHLCHDCGCIWRPADVPTNGVGAIETQGKADTWAPERGNAERALVAGDALREALTGLTDRFRKIRIVTGRDEHSPDYADGYEEACEMAADEIDALLAKLDTAEKGNGE